MEGDCAAGGVNVKQRSGKPRKKDAHAPKRGSHRILKLKRGWKYGYE